MDWGVEKAESLWWELLSQPCGVSDECEHSLRSLARKDGLRRAYKSFLSMNKECLEQQFSPCWDKQYKRFAQGHCKLSCSKEVGELQSKCESYSAQIITSKVELGLDGTTVEARFPLCVPTNCSPDDIQQLQTSARGFCNKIPIQLLPTCSVLLGNEPQEFNWNWVILGCVSFLLICSVLGYWMCRKKKNDVMQGGEERHFGIVLRTPLLDNLVDTSEFRLNSPLQEHLLGPNMVDIKPGGHSLLWRNVFYKKGGVQVLGGITGCLESGRCLAIIGAPDSGATTLLKVLAGIAKGGKFSGEVLIDGKPADETTFKTLGYVPKEDISIPTLTVRETFAFSLAMRSSLKMGSPAFEERVTATLQMLGLEHVQDTRVGDQIVRGISGGEKRRVSLGVEAIVGKSILLADSPTNGLDATAAFEVIKTARVLADSGLSSLMATIRQPSEPLLKQFHTCCLISRGKVIYFGPSASAVEYFNRFEFTRPFGKSVPDYLEALTGDASVFREAHRRQTPDDVRLELVRKYRESEEHKELAMQVWRALDKAADELDMEDVENEETWMNTFNYLMGNNMYVTGLFTQLRLCLWRQVIITIRSPTLRGKLGRQVYLGTLLGCMFYQLDYSQQAARNRYGMIFMVATSVVFGSLAFVPQLFQVRQVYYAQRAGGYYRAVAFHVSLLLCELPIMVGEGFLLCTLLYLLSGLNNGVFSENYWYLVATHIQLNFTASSMCLLGVILAPSAVVAIAGTPTIMAIMVLFSGYLVPRDALPLRWLNDLSMLARPIKGLALNELEGIVFSCTQEELVPESTYPGFNETPPLGFYGPAYQACPIASGHLSLFMYGYQEGEQDKWKLFMWNWMFAIVFNILLVIVMQIVDYTVDNSDAVVSELQNRRRSKALKKLTVMISPSVTEEILETSPGTVEFRNLNYSVDVNTKFCRKPKYKQLLFGVSGVVKSGNMTALMGSSGAGKTTLLDVLAGKNTGGLVDHEALLINGKPRDKYFARIAGYVEQMDSHLPTQTVLEAVTSSAYLRLDSTHSPEVRKQQVRSILVQLGLVPFENELIGLDVSPEVRKKVTIAVELVFNPAILFLDEPTTSLDSKSALAVMQTVRASCQHKAVLCTIHQPSAEVFEVFDSMLLLQKGGRVCYFGPVSRMSQYFQSIGLEGCPADANPADYALECANTVKLDPATEYDKSKWKQDILSNVGTLDNEIHHGFTSVYASSFRQQLWQCLMTQFNYYRRDTSLIKVRCYAAFGYAMMLGGLFYKLGRSQTDAQSRVALIFIALVYCGYSTVLTIPKIIDQRAVFFREYSSNMYSLLAYYMAACIAEVPFILLQIASYAIPFYPLVGLRTDGDHVLLFAIGITMTALTTFAFASVVGTLVPNSDIGIIVCTVSNSVFTLFCGFLLPYNSIPAGFKFLYYISYYRYILGFLIANELQGMEFNCGEDVFGNGGHDRAIPVFVGGLNATTPPPPYGLGTPNATCEQLLVTNYTEALNEPYCFRYYCPIIEGDALLERFSFPETEEEKTQGLMMLFVFYFVFRALALFFLYKIQHVVR